MIEFPYVPGTDSAPHGALPLHLIEESLVPEVSTSEAAMTLIGGLLTGGFVTQVWSYVTGGKKRRLEEEAAKTRLTLEETEVITRLSAAFREEIRQENNELRERMDKVVSSLTQLTDLLDDVFPKIQGLTVEEMYRLRAANNEAKRAA